MPKKKEIKKLIKERPLDELQPYEFVINQMYLGDGKDQIKFKSALIKVLNEDGKSYKQVQFSIKPRTRLDQELNKILEAVKKIK